MRNGILRARERLREVFGCGGGHVFQRRWRMVRVREHAGEAVCAGAEEELGCGIEGETGCQVLWRRVYFGVNTVSKDRKPAWKSTA